jgi:hypothetical protein
MSKTPPVATASAPPVTPCDAANPLTFEALREKLSQCAAGVISKEKQDILFNNILNIHKVKAFDTINIYNEKFTEVE